MIQGINTVRASGTTDAAGRVSLSIPDASGDYQISVRKIGYTRGDHFFHAASAPSSVDVVMRQPVRIAQRVQVTEQGNVKKRSYFIDADEIAQHADILFDASDILRKLRPDMICGRNCSPGSGENIARVRTPTRACPGLAFSQPRRCAANTAPPSLATNAWVNGVWIRTIGYEDQSSCQIGHRGMLAGLSAGTMEVLCDIQPEHVAQMTYVDDYDTTIGKIGSNNALFIVLKPGIAYTPGKKSYVADNLANAGVRDSIAPHAPAVVATSDSVSRDSLSLLPPYRHRLLGLFDDTSGEPIEGAHVIDDKSGTFATTPASGIVSLVFLPEGPSAVRITKPGYDDLTLNVAIAADSTRPLTLVMKKR